MPLFGGRRDSAFIRRVNNEILQKVVGVEVAVYKLAVDDTESNIYGESSKKVYYNPVRLHALVRRDDTISVNGETGEIDKNKNVSIALLRDELIKKNVVIEISDIIVWDDDYYQVDNVKASTYWWGRNPASSIPVQEGDVNYHGYAISIVAECHLTSIGNLNIVDTRSGINSITTKSGLMKNL